MRGEEMQQESGVPILPLQQRQTNSELSQLLRDNHAEGAKPDGVAASNIPEEHCD